MRFNCLSILLIFVSSAYCRLVQYEFIVRYVIGAPDGYPRPVITVYNASLGERTWDRDRPFPGSIIRATVGDTLEVTFKNLMRSQSTSIHFHGLHMFENPWMDGVDMITQCPTLPGETFTYRFNVTQTGTFWYHSHSNQQYTDGLIGPIIIDYSPPELDPISTRFPYDPSSDYPIMLQEWYHETWEDLMGLYQSEYNSTQNHRPRYPWAPTSVLINGRGRFDCLTRNCDTVKRNMSQPKKCNETIQCIPLRDSYFGACQPSIPTIDEFVCHNNEFMRLRLINAASSAPLRFWIDQHSMIIVARDSLLVKEYEVPYVTVPIGQRLDVIVRCNQSPPLKYNMYVAFPENFVAGVNPDNWMNALLVYPGATNISSPETTPKSNFSDDVLFEYKNLRPETRMNQTIPAAKKRITILFGVIYGDSERDTTEEWQMNGKTFVAPIDGSLLQAGFLDSDVELSIPKPTTGHLGNSYETYIEYLDLNQYYEILLINNDTQQHPFHLHGHSVAFIDAGNYTNLTTFQYDICNEYKVRMENFDYNLTLPSFDEEARILSYGDSFTVPRKGFVLFRFLANNPGPWFLHCHMEWHISPGLAVVFSVGNEKNRSYKNLFKGPPVDDYRVCGLSKQKWPGTSSSSIPFSSSNSMIKIVLPLVILSLARIAL